MSSSADALNDSLYRYGSRQPGLWRSATLALVVHLFLLGMLVLGVHMQSHAPEVVTVELWEPPAVETKPLPPKPVEAPKPPPPPPAPKVEPKPEPAPPIKKPDIAVREKPKPKPPAPPKVQPKPKPAPKRDVELEKRMREQLALEQQQVQKQLQQEEQAAAQAREEQQLKALIAQQQAAAASKALADWTDKIRQKIRGNITYDLSRVPGNPEAVFHVTLLPTGEVLNVTRMKSSGNPGYDDAVERAIRKSSPLPQPDSREVFRRQLELHFHPLDQ